MPVSTIQNASLASGVPSAAKLPAGSVLQVVQSSFSTQTDTTSTTYSDTGLSASITPTSSSSKVLVLVSQAGLSKFGGSGGGSYMALRLLRNGIQIVIFENQILYSGSTLEQNGSASTVYLDSPATTSSTTYKTQFRNAALTGTVRLCTDTTTATITLMEIAA